MGQREERIERQTRAFFRFFFPAMALMALFVLADVLFDLGNGHRPKDLGILAGILLFAVGLRFVSLKIITFFRNEY